MKLIFLSIALIHFVFCQITRLPQCNKYGGTFKVSKQKIKDGIDKDSGRVGGIRSEIDSKEKCSTLCIGHPRCKSAFYKPSQGKCYLYDKKFESDNLEEDQSNYYLWFDDDNQAESLVRTYFRGRS